MAIPSNCFTIDFESTGPDPEKCEPLEVAIVSSVGGVFYSLIKPEGDIPVESSAVHHIVASDVADARGWSDVRSDIVQLAMGTASPIFVAHNAEYERTVLGDVVGVAWICTYKAALRVWPECPSFKNEVLRYWLGLPGGRNFIQQTHSALHDALITQQIFDKLLEKATIEQMLQWTIEPSALPRIPIGKHRGAKWEDIPADYLEWVLRQIDMNPDIVFCARRELNRRFTKRTN